MPTPNHLANDYWPGEYFFVSNATSMVSSVAEIQNFTIGATSGTFTLSMDATSVGLGSITTGAIAYNANTTTLASNITTALDAAFGTGAFVVTGNNAPYSITAGSAWAGVDLPLFSSSTASLVSGTITIASATAGVTGTLGRIAPKGALVLGANLSTPKLYINTGTNYLQTWTVVGTQS